MAEAKKPRNQTVKVPAVERRPYIDEQDVKDIRATQVTSDKLRAMWLDFENALNGDGCPRAQGEDVHHHHDLSDENDSIEGCKDEHCPANKKRVPCPGWQPGLFDVSQLVEPYEVDGMRIHDYGIELRSDHKWVTLGGASLTTLQTYAPRAGRFAVAARTAMMKELWTRERGNREGIEKLEEAIRAARVLAQKN